MMSFSSYLTVMLVALVWGYFAELRKGEVGWFIGRLIFTTIFYVLFCYILLKFG